jgi:membrane protein DedA with SNARE-associated domain
MNSLLDFITSDGHSGPAIAAALFLIPFIHEDIAIVAAALLIAQQRLSMQLAFPSLYCGMVARDLFLYSLGVAARRNATARRFLIRPRVQLLSEWLGGNMPWVIFVGRVMPGLMFPTYIAFGWFNLSFKRYALVTSGLSILYLPIVFTLAYGLGRAAVDRVGSWAWLIVLVPVLMILLLRLRVTIRRRLAGRSPAVGK